MKNDDTQNHYAGCPVQHALQFLGGKWQIGILWHLRDEPLRFNMILQLFPGLTEKVLNQNLKNFQSRGIVTKEIFDTIPMKVEYRLTDDGRTLLPVIEKIIQWGYAHMQEEKISDTKGATPYPAIAAIESSMTSEALR